MVKGAPATLIALFALLFGKTSNVAQPAVDDLRNSKIQQIEIIGIPGAFLPNAALDEEMLRGSATVHFSIHVSPSDWRVRCLTYLLRRTNPTDHKISDFDYRWGCILRTDHSEQLHAIF